MLTDNCIIIKNVMAEKPINSEIIKLVTARFEIWLNPIQTKVWEKICEYECIPVKELFALLVSDNIIIDYEDYLSLLNTFVSYKIIDIRKELW